MPMIGPGLPGGENERLRRVLLARLRGMGNPLSRFAKGGQNRGVARSAAGPRGVGVRIGQLKRPGGLDFTSLRAFPGQGVPGRGNQPAMVPGGGNGQARHAPPVMPGQLPGGVGPMPGSPSMLQDGSEDLRFTDADPFGGMNPEIASQPSGMDAKYQPRATTNTGEPLATNGLIPLGNGAYYDPRTGQVHGTVGGGGGGVTHTAL